MADLERVYREKRFCQVWVIDESKKSLLDNVLHRNRHLIRKGLTLQEAEDLAKLSRQVRGQEKVKIVNIMH